MKEYLTKLPEFKTYQEKLDWCRKNNICPDCERSLDETVTMCTRWHGSPNITLSDENPLFTIRKTKCPKCGFEVLNVLEK